MTLNTTPQWGQQADAIYNDLLDAHQGLSFEESQQFNTRLLLILMNQIGDRDILSQAIKNAAIPVSDANDQDTKEPTGQTDTQD